MRSGLLNRMMEFACRTPSAKLVVVSALSGVVVSPAFAQELQPANRPQAPYYTGVEEFEASRIQKYERRTTQSPVKNYYQELFGDQTSQKLIPVKTATLSTPVSTAPEQIELSAGEAPVLNAQYEYAEEGVQEFKVTPVSHESELPPWARNVKATVKPESSNSVPVHPASQTQTVLPTVKMNLTPASSSLPTVPAVPNVPDMGQTGSHPHHSAPQTVKEVTAGVQNPNIVVEWQTAEGINVGQESQCELVIKNNGTSTAYNVSVNAQFPEMVTVLAASPESSDPSATSWQLGNLKAGETRSIQVTVLPTERGALNATAEVHFTAAAQSAFVVREPMLGISLQGPTEVLVGDPASQSVTITNPGNGIAKNVKLEALIPAGLEHPRGERLIMDVGSLNPGEARTIRLAVVAVTGGEKLVQVKATADGGLLQESSSTVKVIAPSLVAEVEGPGLRYKGRNAKYTLRVANDGTIGTSNVRMMHKIPEGFEYISSSRGASYDQPTRILSWFVGKLEPGKDAVIEVELQANRIGEFTHYVRATSEHGSTTDTQIDTRVEGASALVMDIVDLDDPVEVGNETAYEIKVTNEGSAAAENVGISCELPEGVKFVSAKGPSEVAVDQNLVLFKPLNSIPAGQTVTYRVHVVGSVDGNLRFRARMTSASSPDPLTFEELTRFYGDSQ